MHVIKMAVAIPAGLFWMFAGPITYILLVVETWQSQRGAMMKIVVNLTFDVVLAAVWPLTWIIWLFSELLGVGSPLSRVLVLL